MKVTSFNPQTIRKMFSSTAYQPQVAAALTHVSTMINSMRHGSSSVLIPKAGRGQRVVSRQHRSEVTEGSSKEVDTDTVKEAKADNLDLESCIAILLQQDSMKKLAQLLGVPENSHWKTNYVSAPTFFENKTGFEEHMLNMPASGGFSLFLRPEVARLLSQNLSPAHMYSQRRGYRQEHHGRKSGLGTAGFEKTQSIFSKLVSGPKQALDRQSLHRILKDEKPDVQDKIKVAFTEGVMSKETNRQEDTQTRLKKNAFRLFLWAIFAYFLYKTFLSKGGAESGTGGFPMLNQGRFEVNPEEVNVNFSDVKGCDEAKEELADIVEFLKNRDKFQAVGAKLPKGVLMVGSPGVGKTLLAKAVAGEADVPFFQASGSEFDEMFVGSGSKKVRQLFCMFRLKKAEITGEQLRVKNTLHCILISGGWREAGVAFFQASGSEFDEVFVGTGAKKVRQLFSAAKQRAPSVIFIDEIDSVGAKRTNSQIHPYANQTVNQLLSEMDGFSGSSGVIVIGATNKRENLDQALLRPGRFDMEVNVLPPDANGREEIFKLYLSKVHASKELDIKKLGLLSRGMTGADINNIVNQAALRAVLQGHNIVTMEDLDYARDKIIMGPAWKNKKIDEKTNWNTAYHEAGHTLVAYFSKEAMPLHKVTILPRGQSLGHTSFMPEEDLQGNTKAQLLARIDVAMGGRVGEELMHGKEHVTDGASSDFQSATRIATMMVKKLGMSEKVGQRVHNDPAMDGGNAFIQVNDVSPETQQVIDTEINRILSEAYARATEILKSHHKEHLLLSQALMKYETLDKEEIKTVIEGRPLKRSAPEKKKK